MSRALAACALLIGSCGGAASQEFGLHVDPAEAVDLAAALTLADAGEVTLRGRIAEVCDSSGCWFVLRERRGADLHELFVNLLASEIRLGPDSRGREVVVRGKLVGPREARELRAVGLRLE
jgi:hypothetical protein